MTDRESDRFNELTKDGLLPYLALAVIGGKIAEATAQAEMAVRKRSAELLKLVSVVRTFGAGRGAN
jgi:3-oxoacyl-ACP reductase-like protein